MKRCKVIVEVVDCEEQEQCVTFTRRPCSKDVVNDTEMCAGHLESHLAGLKSSVGNLQKEIREKRAEYIRLHQALIPMTIPDDVLTKIAGWAWLTCDQTVACPCCGIAWWGTDGDLDDDWHEPGCELQALRVAAGVSSGKRVDRGTPAFEPSRRPDPAVFEDGQRLREAWMALYQLVPWDAISKDAWEHAQTIGDVLRERGSK